jgi:hypothetical protein
MSPLKTPNQAITIIGIAGPSVTANSHLARQYLPDFTILKFNSCVENLVDSAMAPFAPIVPDLNVIKTCYGQVPETNVDYPQMWKLMRDFVTQSIHPKYLLLAMQQLIDAELVKTNDNFVIVDVSAYDEIEYVRSLGGKVIYNYLPSMHSRGDINYPAITGKDCDDTVVFDEAAGVNALHKEEVLNILHCLPLCRYITN